MASSQGTTPAGGSVWLELLDLITEGSPPAQVLPVDPSTGRLVLARLGVSEHSMLGGLAANTGGVVLDHGWLRILGGGAPGLPDIATANDEDPGPASHLIVAQDVLGGCFAVDGGGLGVAAGEVCYWGPDTLSWMGIECGHTAFVTWALGGGSAGFYRQLRWPGWERETADLPLDHGISLYPPPFTEQGQDLGAASRRPVPYRELSAFCADTARQLEANETGDGAPSRRAPAGT